jgi:hypothetical protein
MAVITLLPGTGMITHGRHNLSTGAWSLLRHVFKELSLKSCCHIPRPSGD